MTRNAIAQHGFANNYGSRTSPMKFALSTTIMRILFLFQMATINYALTPALKALEVDFAASDG